MNIDLSFINQSQIVVHTKNKSDAVKLIESVRKNYPHCFSEDSASVMIGVWSRHKGDTAYRFRLRPATESVKEAIICGYCYTEWYKAEGYNVIEFEDLITGKDLGEINFEFSSKADALSALF